MAVESKLADIFSARKVAVAGGILLSCTTLLSIWRRWRKQSKMLGPPVPSAPGEWPIIGHPLSVFTAYCPLNLNLAFQRHAVDMQRNRGLKIYQSTIMGQTSYNVQDPELAQIVYEGEPHRFTKDFSKAPMGGDLMEYSFAKGLFAAASDDIAWKVAHGVLLSPFSLRGIRGIMPLICEQADEFIKAVKKHHEGPEKAMFMDRWLVKMAFETIAVCGLGSSFGSFDDPQEHPFVTKLNQVVEEMTPLATIPQCLRWLFCPKQLKEYLEKAASCRQTCLDLIRRRGSEEQKDVKKDLLDRMLLDVDPKTGRAMTENSIVDNVLTFLFAGQDSTAAAMGSCLCYLCSKPECKERLIREIDEVVGDDDVNWEHLNKLQYLDWCVKETLRLVPSVTGSLRYTVCDQLLGGFHVPAEATVTVNLFGLHYNKDYWGPDVDEFKPERFEKGIPHKFAFMPFAHGPRQCIGREFGMVEIKVTLVKFFQNFDLEAVPATEEHGYSIIKPGGQFPPFFNFDTQTKNDTAFLGFRTSFKLFPRNVA